VAAAAGGGGWVGERAGRPAAAVGGGGWVGGCVEMARQRGVRAGGRKKVCLNLRGRRRHS
jgi:hypothetical protein